MQADRPKRPPTTTVGVLRFAIRSAAQQHGMLAVYAWLPWICCQTSGMVPNTLVTNVKENKVGVIHDFMISMN